VKGDHLEIAGVLIAVNELKAVRERDARLLARLHEEREGAATTIVADRISTAAREELSRVGLAWFDRRGHLWVRCRRSPEVPQSWSPKFPTCEPGLGLKVHPLRWGSFEAGGSYASQPEGAPLPCSHEEKTWKLMH
jgi:hypothetical protein